MSEEQEPVEEEEPKYNLENARVLHCEHPIQANIDTPAAAVVPGFSWAEAGEGQGLFLCRCRSTCEDTQACGRTFFDDIDGDKQKTGHLNKLAMPWGARDGTLDLEVFDLWCCDVCTATGTGATFDTWVGRFYDIPARLLSYVHETRSHTYTGARTSLGKRFPDEFAEAAYVTLILYRRTS